MREIQPARLFARNARNCALPRQRRFRSFGETGATATVQQQNGHMLDDRGSEVPGPGECGIREVRSVNRIWRYDAWSKSLTLELDARAVVTPAAKEEPTIPPRKYQREYPDAAGLLQLRKGRSCFVARKCSQSISRPARLARYWLHATKAAQAPPAG